MNNENMTLRDKMPYFVKFIRLMADAIIKNKTKYERIIEQNGITYIINFNEKRENYCNYCNRINRLTVKSLDGREFYIEIKHHLGSADYEEDDYEIDEISSTISIKIDDKTSLTTIHEEEDIPEHEIFLDITPKDMRLDRVFLGNTTMQRDFLTECFEQTKNGIKRFGTLISFDGENILEYDGESIPSREEMQAFNETNKISEYLSQIEGPITIEKLKEINETVRSIKNTSKSYKDILKSYDYYLNLAKNALQEQKKAIEWFKKAVFTNKELDFIYHIFKEDLDKYEVIVEDEMDKLISALSSEQVKSLRKKLEIDK